MKRTRIISLCLKIIVAVALSTVWGGSFRTSTLLAQDNASLVSRQRVELAANRKVFVRSKSLLVSGAVVEDKLLKRPEFGQMGFVITRDERDADIVVELRHDLLTKYVFSVIDVRSQEVVAGGKLSSLGGTVAGKLAKRFVKEMKAVKYVPTLNLIQRLCCG